MKIDRILYTHTYQIGLSNWEKIGLEATIDDTDDPKKSLEILKEEVHNFHRISNPQLYKNGNEAIVDEFDSKWKYAASNQFIPAEFSTKPLVINREYERKQIEIENTKSLEELAQFKEYCGKNPDLMPIYMSKMKSLTEKIKTNI